MVLTTGPISVGERKIRVCLVIPRLAIGGAEIQVLTLAKHLDKSKFEVSILSLGNGLAEMEQEARHYVRSLGVIRFRLRYAAWSLARMVVWLRRGRFDVIHCHMPFADLLGRLAGRLAGIPVVATTEHGRNVWKPWYYLLVERMLNRITDVRICVSQDILEIRRRRERTPAHKLVRIPPGVDVARLGRSHRGRAEVLSDFGWDPHDVVVVSVGRLEPEKNYPVLIKAMGIVVSGHGNAKCLLVGSGSLDGQLRSLIESLGLDRAVRLAGGRRDIPDILGAADIFVLASSKEGLPVALLEAMAAGKAAVVTAVGGMPEVITDGENGLVVPAGDAVALAGALGRLVGDDRTRVEMGRLAMAQAARDFSVATVAGRTGRLYVDILTSKRKHLGRPQSTGVFRGGREVDR